MHHTKLKTEPLHNNQDGQYITQITRDITYQNNNNFIDFDQLPNE